MDEQRLVDIEVKIAHQEHLLSELNDALSSQQAQIMQLSTTCDSLINRIRSMSDDAPAGNPVDERPPHY